MLRRLYILGLVGVTLASACLAYGFWVEPHRLVVREITIASHHYGGEPVRIGVVSDIHAGVRKVYAEDVAAAVAALNDLNPDIVLIPGDFTVGSEPRQARSPEERADIDTAHIELGKLSAPLGVYAVLGNHDHQYGATATTEALSRLGISFLDNEVTDIDGRVCLFGLADEWFGRPDDTTPSRCAADRPRIGFAHNPDTLLRQLGGHALLLAGHTHGGQINVPLIGRRVTATEAGEPYAYGEVSFNGSPGFVTAGLGMSGLAARFRAPPEVVLITLVPAKEP